MNVLQSKFPSYLEFSVPELHQELLLQKVTSLEEYFVPSRIYNKAVVRDINVRNSLSLRSISLLKEEFAIISGLVSSKRGLISDALRVASYSEGRTEYSCLWYGDGSHFSKHTDFSPERLERRVLTWIYYFFHEPAKFSGGALDFFDDGNNNSIARYQPRSGSLIVFRADSCHEVGRVILQDNNFAHGRFALTGFVNEKVTLRSVNTTRKFFTFARRSLRHLSKKDRLGAFTSL